MTPIHRWLVAEPRHEVDGDAISIHAAARTDWFNDPRTGERTSTAPVGIVYDGEPPVTVTCSVELVASSTFDAACLFAHESDDRWVKLALERDPSGTLRVVTVVTDGRSDDCNHSAVPGRRCDLRLSLDGTSIALHFRTDRTAWQLARYRPSPFRSAPGIGLCAQSPEGSGVTARFADVTVERRAIDSLRDGT
jgi:regulation of enolase protein 1 (concanavalin A-like superfamily)